MIDAFTRFGRWIAGPIALLCAGAGFWLAQDGFDEIQRLRELDRIPVSQRMGAVLAGAVALQGTARTAGLVLGSPRTDTPSIYYRYRHEIETRDADGNKRWETRVDRAAAVDFVVADASGAIRVPAQRDFNSIEFSARQRHQDTQGSNRYTEWRIEPGDPVVMFGTAEIAAGGMEMDFRRPRGPVPIISGFSADAERQGVGRSGLFGLWAGIALLALAVLALALALGLHRVLAYLSLLSLVLGLALVQFGVQMMRTDLQAGVEMLRTRETAAQERFARALAQAGIAFADIRELDALDGPAFTALGSVARSNLQTIRLELEGARLGLQRQFDAFPERWLAPVLGIQAPRRDSFLAATRAGAARDLLPATTRITSAWVVPLALFCVLIAGLCTWFGFGRVRLKRLMEGLPTSASSGASCGLTELQGVVEALEGDASLSSPLSATACVWFDYRVEELRTSGKRSSWHVIETRQERMAFLCRDAEGALCVEPQGAEILSSRGTRERRGNLRYTERVLGVGDACYVLGHASVHGERADRLAIGAGDAGEPFLLSNYPERAVMLYKAFAGLALLNVALTGLTLALLLAFAARGSFSPADFLLAALAAPSYMLGVMLVLHYNDLLFLRERARRNWANIQVSLRKRRNLVRPLNAMVGKYMTHERDLQVQLARMRTEMRTATENPAAAARYLAAEDALEREFRAVIENYPQLQASASVARLSAALTRLENEVALMRTGYNDAVEHYNARVDTFPDLLLARVFRFARMDFVAL